VPDQSIAAHPDYLSGLNEDQREAATYGIGAGQTVGPLLIIAGAGSGKTNTLAHRTAIAYANVVDLCKKLFTVKDI